MDINKFLEQNEGKWFSQRTIYNLNQETAENSKSNLSIELLKPDNEMLVKLCQQQEINPTAAIGAIKTNWDNSIDGGKKAEKGTNLLVLIANDEQTQEGKILLSNQNKTASVGSYVLGEDEALTLILKENKLQSQERIWFVSPNLRLRTSLIKQGDKFISTSFYSEIRRLNVES